MSIEAASDENSPPEPEKKFILSAERAFVDLCSNQEDSVMTLIHEVPSASPEPRTIDRPPRDPDATDFLRKPGNFRLHRFRASLLGEASPATPRARLSFSGLAPSVKARTVIPMPSPPSGMKLRLSAARRSLSSQKEEITRKNNKSLRRL